MSGWNNASDLVVAGTGQVYVADTDSSVPTAVTTDLDADSDFFGLGYHTEDGVSVNRDVELLRLRAWQSKVDIRRERQSEAFRITFALQQWNEETVPLAFGGGEVVSQGGGYRFNPPQVGDALDERMLVCDVVDGSEIIRFIIERGNVVEGVESQFTATSSAALPVTFEALASADSDDLPWHFLTNSAAFAAGS